MGLGLAFCGLARMIVENNTRCGSQDSFIHFRMNDQGYVLLQEHLFLVCELLRANLYEFQKFTFESGNKPYFVVPRVQMIARQVGNSGFSRSGFSLCLIVTSQFLMGCHSHTGITTGFLLS